MAIHVYVIATGAHYSSVPDAIALADAQAQGIVATDEQLAVNGFAAVEGDPVDETHAWDATSKTVIVVSARYKSRMIAVGTWILRFTAIEFAGIRASTDANAQHLMFALENADPQGIDLNSSTVINGVGYLVSINLLDASRVAAIMA